MFDPSDDFPGVVDGLEAVDVRRPGQPTATAVAHALRQPVQPRTPEPTHGCDTAGDAAWHLPVAELAEPPRPGDTIVDASGQCWTVFEVSRRVLGGRWRCVARNLAVYYRLDESVDLEEAHFAKSDGGADEPTWRVRKAGLRARIQPATATIRAEQDRQTGAERFKIFLADELPSESTLRIRGPRSVLYAITGYRRADAIDAVMEIDAVRVE